MNERDREITYLRRVIYNCGLLVVIVVSSLFLFVFVSVSPLLMEHVILFSGFYDYGRCALTITVVAETQRQGRRTRRLSSFRYDIREKSRVLVTSCGDVVQSPVGHARIT